MSEKFFVGRDIVSFSNNGAYKPIVRVTLLVDDEVCKTSPNNEEELDGLELVASCPYATQEMADALLAQFSGYQYQAFEAGAAGIDPAAELGDGVTVNGIYGMIAQISDDGSGYPSLSAPGEAEMEDEYPAPGPATQEFNRKIAETRSMITKTAEEIRLEVFGEDGYTGTALKVTLDGIAVTTTNADGSKTITLKDGVVTANSIAANAVTSDKIAANVSIESPSLILRTPLTDVTSADQPALHVIPIGQETPFGSIYYSHITNPGEYESAHNLWITTREWSGVASAEPTGSIKIRSGYRMSIEARVALYLNGGTQGISFGGPVDFANATVSGLSGVTAVFG